MGVILMAFDWYYEGELRELDRNPSAWQRFWRFHWFRIWWFEVRGGLRKHPNRLQRFLLRYK
jgi:hypothetical protein